MKTTRKIVSITAAALAAGVSLALLPPAHAETLTFTNAPASSAAAAMSRRFGVTIVFRDSVNTQQPVSFSVDNPDTPDGRLQAVSNLASALDMDFQKVYVVSKIDPGTTVPPIKLDSNGPIVFSATHLTAREAIQTVAAVDSAVTQISSLVDGEVDLSATHLSATEAAAEIAKQTGTQWKAYYGLFRRGDAPQRLSGLVIGQTNGGQPITELPLLTYRNSVSTPAPLHDGRDAVVGPLAPLSSDPNVASVPDTNFGLAPDDGLNGYGYGDPYGYTNPYGPYGYATANGGIAYPGSVYAPGAGVSPAVPGINAPGGTAILPNFPYMGNVGGTTTVGGY